MENNKSFIPIIIVVGLVLLLALFWASRGANAYHDVDGDDEHIEACLKDFNESFSGWAWFPISAEDYESFEQNSNGLVFLYEGGDINDIGLEKADQWCEDNAPKPTPSPSVIPSPSPTPESDCEEREFGLYCSDDPSPVDNPNEDSNEPGDETDCSEDSGISTERRLNDCGGTEIQAELVVAEEEVVVDLGQPTVVVVKELESFPKTGMDLFGYLR